MSKNTSIQRSAVVGKSSNKASGCSSGFSRNAKTLADLVDAYERCQQISEKGWNPLRSLLEGYRGLGDLETAIKRATFAEDIVGKSYRKEGESKVNRHGHQRRIKRAVLEDARRVLASKSNIKKLETCSSFEGIFDFVSRNCEEIHGLGALYVYDTALRIGAFSKKLPKRVYLQAGALTGARALGLDVKNPPLSASAFPKAMQHLAPIYKDQLAKVKI